MVSASTRVESVHTPIDLTPSSSSSNSSTNSFAQQLATALEGYLNQSSNGSQLNINVSEVSGRNSGGSQFLVTVTPSEAPPTGSRSNGTAITVATPATAAPLAGIPTMLGMGPVAGTPPVVHVTTPQPAPVATATETEGDAYWAAQPAAVQTLRNMPDSEAKDQLALKLANQGYSIDTQIMVWGWDPQMTMTVRQNQGYAWVPSYGQSNVPVGPGLSDPYEPVSYNPANPPPGSIAVSTAFANGTIQNPLVQTNSTST